MHDFLAFLDDLNKEYNVRFDLLSKNIKFHGINGKTEDTYSIDVKLGNEQAVVVLRNSDKKCADLLKYVIENRYSQIYLSKIEMFIKILNGEHFTICEDDEAVKHLKDGFQILLIYTDGNNFDALELIKSFYEVESITCFIYDRYIVIISNFEDAEEHAKAIKELVTSNLYYECYVAYSKIYSDVYQIRDIYNKLYEILNLGIKYKVKPGIYSHDNMILEKIVSNVNVDMKTNLMNDYKQKMDLLDNDIMNTIEEFINCDLNVSNTAKKLYVHRNTLIYRIDKIKKVTGFDIRNFKQAMVFYTIFLLWKEYKRRG